MLLKTRLTERFGLRHPIVSAPMAFAAGGALAAAVTAAGGLGLIGGGYGDPGWLDEQFREAGNQKVGCGFITWSLRKSPSVLTDVLRHKPVAIMLSFGDPAPFAEEIRAAGATLICQCQTLDHAEDAIAAGAGIIVAQGGEAGGHGMGRGTLTLVPEVADLIRQRGSDTLLLAAGGIGDGRGLAAALMLGADGVLLGTRLWATREALVKERHHQAILETAGDGTIRTTIADVVRQLAWPRAFTARIRQNTFTQRWHGREDALAAAIAEEGPRYRKAFVEGDPEDTAVWFGEAAGLIHDIPEAATVLTRIAAEAAALLANGPRSLAGA